MGGRVGVGGGGEGRAGIGGRGGVRGRGRAGGVSASVIDVEIALFGTRGCRRWGGGGRRGGRLGVDEEIALLGTRGIGEGRRGMGGVQTWRTVHLRAQGSAGMDQR